jgi:Holliday junction resolvase-like predicted endonuclease
MAQLFNAELSNYRIKIADWRTAEEIVRAKYRRNGYTVLDGRVSAEYDWDWYIRGREYDVVAYKMIGGKKHWELVEVKFSRRTGERFASGPAKKAIKGRKAIQMLTISRQVNFDLTVSEMTLTGRQILGRTMQLEPEDYNISWEFVRSNGKSVSIDVSNVKEFTDSILELTGG